MRTVRSGARCRGAGPVTLLPCGLIDTTGALRGRRTRGDHAASKSLKEGASFKGNRGALLAGGPARWQPQTVRQQPDVGGGAPVTCRQPREPGGKVQVPRGLHRRPR